MRKKNLTMDLDATKGQLHAFFDCYGLDEDPKGYLFQIAGNMDTIFECAE